MKRKIRRSIDSALTLVGITLIFASFVFQSAIPLTVQFMLILLGILIMEVGVWSLSSRILPNQRRFPALRTEGDHMIELIRELNAAAIVKDRGEEDARRFQEALANMHESVVRMAELAAKEQ